MNQLIALLTNRLFLCGLTSWFAAQALKIPTYYLVEKKVDFSRFFESGGMPSSHTALVVSLTLLLGFMEGFGSNIFVVSLAFSTIVMYDATGVRRETGNQAQIINTILQHLFVDGKPIRDDELKELVGHTPLEVFCGAIVGLVVALFWAP